MLKPHVLGPASIALVALAVLLRLTVFTSAVPAAETMKTLSPSDLHRSADVAALPVQEAADPF